MQFHTVSGVPIQQVPSETLQKFLIDGFKIITSDGRPNPEKSVIAQIEIVLLARSLGLMQWK